MEIFKSNQVGEKVGFERYPYIAISTRVKIILLGNVKQNILFIFLMINIPILLINIIKINIE